MAETQSGVWSLWHTSARGREEDPGAGASLGDSSDVGVVQVGISPTRLLLHKLDDTALFLLLLLWYKQSLPRIRVVRSS